MPRARLRVVFAILAVCGCAPSQEGIHGDAGASACGECHTTEYAAWATSRLATSGSSPVFKALSASAASAWGPSAQARCVACHQPGYGGDHGIGCVSCHAATGNLADRDGLLTVDVTAPVSGPFSAALPTPAHGSQAYGFLESADLCGTCHEVTGPGLFHETTLDEYSASSAATAGAVCATCHMPALSQGPIAVGLTNKRTRTDHSFVGVDPPWAASAIDQQTAAHRTLELLRLGLTLTAVAAHDGQGIDVSLTNSAGHATPTGVAFLRDIWVDVDFIGSDGTTASVPSVLELGAQPTRSGQPVALITQADAIESHALAAGATISVHVVAGPTVSSPIRAVITLRARAVRPAVLEALALEDAGTEVPTHEVAVVRIP